MSNIIYEKVSVWAIRNACQKLIKGFFRVFLYIAEKDNNALPILYLHFIFLL